MVKQFYPCGSYQYQRTIVGTLVSLDCNMAGVPSASSSYSTTHGTEEKNTTALLQKTVARRSDFEMLLTQMDFKGTNEKDLLTIKKGPMV